MTKDEALALARTTFPEYKIKWTDSRGDFAGRDVTFEVFGVQFQDEREFIRRAHPFREQLKAGLGSTCIFVFRNVPAPPGL